MKECQVDFLAGNFGRNVRKGRKKGNLGEQGMSGWLCLGVEIFRGWKALIFNGGNICGIVEGGCSDLHAGLQVSTCTSCSLGHPG